MSISVIIPYIKGDTDRREGLSKLFDCIKNQTFRDFELIFSEMTVDGTYEYLRYRPDNRILKKYKGTFNKSWICNIAARNAKNKNLLFLDADTLFDEDYFQTVVDYYSNYKNKFFIAWDKCVMGVGKDEPTERIVDARYMKAAARSWFVEKDFYWNIGGMNEKYFGYGAEDQDMFFRAEHTLKIVMFMPYMIKHHYHDFHPKDSSFPLNPRRVELLEETQRDIQKEIDRLLLVSESLGGEKPHVP